jgi:hypothetical protein
MKTQVILAKNQDGYYFGHLGYVEKMYSTDKQYYFFPDPDEKKKNKIIVNKQNLYFPED